MPGKPRRRQRRRQPREDRFQLCALTLCDSVSWISCGPVTRYLPVCWTAWRGAAGACDFGTLRGDPRAPTTVRWPSVARRRVPQPSGRESSPAFTFRTERVFFQISFHRSPRPTRAGRLAESLALHLRPIRNRTPNAMGRATGETAAPDTARGTRSVRPSARLYAPRLHRYIGRHAPSLIPTPLATTCQMPSTHSRSNHRTSNTCTLPRKASFSKRSVLSTSGFQATPCFQATCTCALYAT